jgi:hypothetical protein
MSNKLKHVYVAEIAQHELAINNTQLPILVYNNQRVVIFAMVDMVDYVRWCQSSNFLSKNCRWA